MFSFTFPKIITMSIIICLYAATESVSRSVGQGTRVAGLSRYRADASRTIPTKPVGVPKPAYHNPHNTSSTGAPRAASVPRNRNRNRTTPRNVPLRKYMSKVRPRTGKILARSRVPTPTKQRRQNEQPTPEPTGDASTSTTVYVSGSNAFALLLPQTSGGAYPVYFVSAFCNSFFFCRDGVRCRARRCCVLHRRKWVRQPIPNRLHHRCRVLGSGGWNVRASRLANQIPGARVGSSGD